MDTFERRLVARIGALGLLVENIYASLLTNGDDAVAGARRSLRCLSADTRAALMREARSTAGAAACADDEALAAATADAFEAILARILDGVESRVREDEAPAET